MKRVLHRITTFLLVTVVTNATLFAANNATYEQRRTDYINTALSNFAPDAITIQAYEGVPVDVTSLNALISIIPTKSTVDFDIVKLVRVLCLSSGQYDTLILPALNSVPFWLTKSDTLRGYWSENHMIMWMSSDWLLHERYGKQVDNQLDYRLRHYLRLKVNFGFYEFFSSTYAPYCLSGLLNLADFAQDTEIKTLATQAAQRLLKDLLMLTTDKGVFYPVAGRNYYGKYETPYNQNHNHLIYLLTGFGDAPDKASHSGGFLATSTIPVDSVIDSWRAELDTVYSIGHTLDTGFVINSGLSPLDKTIFQWSSGAYFHPAVALETANLLTDSNLWHHVDFKLFSGFETLPIPTIVSLSNNLTVASKSTVICGQDAVIFKRNAIALYSIKDFWKGKLGFQQFPVVATVGTTPVFTASGEVKEVWSQRNDKNANEHLPYVVQNRNKALVMYRPEFKPSLLPFNNPEVALFFRKQDFDEVREHNLWLLGRQDENYVAVRRYCTDTISNVNACLMNGGQAWVIIVGDSGMYGNFNQFENVVQQAQFEESWYIDSSTSQYVYYAKTVIDNTTLEYAWGTDTTIETGTQDIIPQQGKLTVFPNPANEYAEIDLSAFMHEEVQLKVFNTLGAEVYAEKLKVFSNTYKAIFVLPLAKGMYTIRAVSSTQSLSAVFVKE
ncbi:MAG: T9SS type A sorting domain-containing protein [Chitinophagales bacterium]|nr:T9SS type A sorting domain-containing protein [Chitinophagales bacterium]